MIAQQRIQYFTTSDYVRVGIEVLNDIMIAQWDSPLSVLPVARVMIAQWDSPLSVLPGVPRGIFTHERTQRLKNFRYGK